MMKFKTKTDFLHACLLVVCLFGTVGFAFGFTKHFDQPVGYVIPTFPNIFDSAFLIFSASYLTWRVLRKK